MRNSRKASHHVRESGQRSPLWHLTTDLDGLLQARARLHRFSSAQMNKEKSKREGQVVGEVLVIRGQVWLIYQTMRGSGQEVFKRSSEAMLRTNCKKAKVKTESSWYTGEGKKLLGVFWRESIGFADGQDGRYSMGLAEVKKSTKEQANTRNLTLIQLRLALSLLNDTACKEWSQQDNRHESEPI